MTELKVAGGTERGRNWAEWGERYGLVIAWLLVILVFSILRPTTFFSWANFSTIFGSQAVLVVMTLGLIVPLTAGDYDLSIAGNLTLSATVIASISTGQLPLRSWQLLQRAWRLGPSMP
jgi:ribose transport system permease protein